MDALTAEQSISVSQAVGLVVGLMAAGAPLGWALVKLLNIDTRLVVLETQRSQDSADVNRRFEERARERALQQEQFNRELQTLTTYLKEKLDKLEKGQDKLEAGQSEIHGRIDRALTSDSQRKLKVIDGQ